MAFEHPNHLLWCAVMVLVLLFIEWRQRRVSGQRIASSASLDALPRSYKTRLNWLPRSLIYLALMLLTATTLNPYWRSEHAVLDKEGLAAVIALDASSSMKFVFDAEQGSRLEVAKQAIDDFVALQLAAPERNEPSSSAPEHNPMPDHNNPAPAHNNLVALVSFAKYTYLESPLTQSYRALSHLVERIDTPPSNEFDGTAFGDAIAFSAALLNEFEQTAESEIKNKILILITDGENNTGHYAPLKAMELAQQWGIKVYTIYISSQRPQAAKPSEVEWTLQEIAQQTGGQYHKVIDADSLEQVYHTINQLEQSKLYSSLVEHQTPLNPLLIALTLLALLGSFIVHNLWLKMV